jgi:DNA-binding LacI/PurR family transcriptional regulator
VRTGLASPLEVISATRSTSTIRTKQLDPTIPKYQLVEDHIKQQIKQREIVDKLPGERVLAAQLGYSYMTIRKAIENLVTEGILYKIPTKGTYVSDGKKPKAKTKTIGYFLDSSIEAGLTSPYYSMIFNALEKEAARNDYTLAYFSDSESAKLNKTLKKLDGVIASCFYRIEDYIQRIKDEVPVVVIDNSASDKSIPSVIIDNFSALADTIDYLCALGHKQIGFMTGLDDSDVGKNRFEGYKTGLKKHDIVVEDKYIFSGNYSFVSGVDGAQYFLSLDDTPTAIVCANDSMALGAMSKLNRENYKVPEDISVIGFDDIEVASQIVPPLTTVSAPADEIASQAFSMLKSLIEGKVPQNQHIALAAELVIRQSSASIGIKPAAV